MNIIYGKMFIYEHCKNVHIWSKMIIYDPVYDKTTKSYMNISMFIYEHAHIWTFLSFIYDQSYVYYHIWWTIYDRVHMWSTTYEHWFVHMWIISKKKCSYVVIYVFICACSLPCSHVIAHIWLFIYDYSYMGVQIWLFIYDCPYMMYHAWLSTYYRSYVIVHIWLSIYDCWYMMVEHSTYDSWPMVIHMW